MGVLSFTGELQYHTRTITLSNFSAKGLDKELNVGESDICLGGLDKDGCQCLPVFCFHNEYGSKLDVAI